VFTATDADEANSHVNNSTTAHGLTIADVVTTYWHTDLDAIRLFLSLRLLIL
jgi:hypothetical protein